MDARLHLEPVLDNAPLALARLRKEFPKADAEGVAADCATAAGAEAVIARVPEVDILVNNLGIYGRMPFFDNG